MLFRFNDNQSVPVQISTTWYEYDSTQSIGHTPGQLSLAVQNGNLMNISMSVQWKELSQAESDVKNQNREWPIGKTIVFVLSELLGKNSIKFRLFDNLAVQARI